MPICFFSGVFNKIFWSLVPNETCMGRGIPSSLHCWTSSRTPLFVYRCCKRRCPCWFTLSNAVWCGISWA
jgi:hypothetical protein